MIGINRDIITKIYLHGYNEKETIGNKEESVIKVNLKYRKYFIVHVVATILIFV